MGGSMWLRVRGDESADVLYSAAPFVSSRAGSTSLALMSSVLRPSGMPPGSDGKPLAWLRASSSREGLLDVSCAVLLPAGAHACGCGNTKDEAKAAYL